MKCLSILAAILCFAAPLTAKSRLETLTLHSQLLNADKSCTVYLPDGSVATAGMAQTFAYIVAGGIVALIVTFAPAIVLKFPEAEMFRSILRRVKR